MRKLFRVITALCALVLLVGVVSLMPARTAMAQGTQSATAPLPPGTVIHAASCEQAPPQSVKDRATYTPAELARYGLPPRSRGEAFDKWAQIVRSAGKRYCDRTVTGIKNTRDLRYDNWAGNIADEPSSHNQTYSEADLNFHVPCVNTGNFDSNASFWVGLGAGNDGSSNLVQTGVDAHRFYVSPWITTYEAWVENLGDAQNSGENDLFSVNCGDNMWVKVWTGNCMYIADLNTGANSGNQCYGPNADTASAEGIAERPELGDYPGGCHCLALLAEFGNVTFHGVGITDNGTYEGVNYTNHDYSNMWSTDGSHELASVGPILYDSTDSPPDMYTVTWKAES